MPRSLLALVVTIALFQGCSTPKPYAADEERPRVGNEARWWELQGNKELARARSSASLSTKERHWANAIRDFREARALYYSELERAENAPSTDVQQLGPYPEIRYAATGPVPAGRREALTLEITRISDDIEQLVRERPIDPPPPLTLAEKLTPP